MPQRNWLITGVSSGFGRIMTEQLLARDDRIAGTVGDLSVMDDLKAKYGERQERVEARYRMLMVEVEQRNL
jgi:NAD(P)-dependent dehydrogenase (short-subunit alcohol dehydrogenase family)